MYFFRCCWVVLQNKRTCVRSKLSDARTSMEIEGPRKTAMKQDFLAPFEKQGLMEDTFESNRQATESGAYD